jgi:hypothetical protein
VADVVRDRLKAAGEETITTQRLKEALELALDSSKRVMCEHCHRPNRVPMPDFTQIEKILNQMYGPLAAPEQVVNHNVLVTAMSLDEKATLLESYRARQAVLVSGGDEAA